MRSACAIAWASSAAWIAIAAPSGRPSTRIRISTGRAPARLSSAFSSRRQTTTRRASHFTHSSTKDHCLWSAHFDPARTGFLAVVEGNRIFAPMHGAVPYRRCCRIQSARAAFITLASFYCEVLSWTGALHHRGSASRNAPAAIPTPFAAPARCVNFQSLLNAHEWRRNVLNERTFKHWRIMD